MMELTPQVVSSSLVLLIVVAPTLTLMLSALLLWRYRRAVTRAMTATGAFDVAGADAAAPAPTRLGHDVGRTVDHQTGHERYRLAIMAPWHGALRHAVGGLVVAIAFAVAARFVYPLRLDAPGFAIGVWIYAWPVALAVPLIVAGRVRLWAASVGVYFLAFLPLWLWAAVTPDTPGYTFGGVVLPARSSATPTGLLKLWLVVNGAPTLLTLLCFNRWVRAVAPLVLALVTTTISGTWIAVLALFTDRGVDATVEAAVSVDVQVYWLVLGVIVMAVAACGTAGWVLAQWIGRAYRRRRISDQSLLLDVLWLLFASMYAMWLALGGVAWAAMAPGAFLAYRLALRAALRLRRVPSPMGVGLTFLRVFSLGRRSDALFNAVARSWRHIGTVQIITGPDVALTTVQPHQFLDYLSGKLARHFIRDRASLERSLVECDRARDPDGRFRINNFFCHADSWQPTLPRLVEDGEAVLMDLRSFSATNAGCIHEIRYVVQHVPIHRCVLIVDRTTDEPFLRRTLQEAWALAVPGSPNHGRSPADVTMYQFELSAPFHRLLRHLCEVGPSQGQPVTAPRARSVHHRHR